MGLTMYQSDRNMVSPQKDASLYHALAGSESGVLTRGDQFKFSVNGLTLTIGTGQAIVQGRLVEVSSPQTITLPSNSSGSICIVVDLSKTNDVSGQSGQTNYAVNVNQVAISAVAGGLTQDDLNNGGSLYEFSLGSYTSTATSASVVQKTRNILFHDTGWIDLALPNGTIKNNSNSYARYRVRDRVVYIRFYNLNCKNSANGNQVVVLPDEIRPNVLGTYVFAGHNFNLNTGVADSCAFQAQDVAVGNVIYGTWNPNTIGDLTGATGSTSYPLGGNA
ncbi:hypothetical protein JK160_02900 [Leuconostoc suionicum]|nr:hypothetical protein [Leuconostoc suionicum]